MAFGTANFRYTVIKSYNNNNNNNNNNKNNNNNNVLIVPKSYETNSTFTSTYISRNIPISIFQFKDANKNYRAGQSNIRNLIQQR